MQADSTDITRYSRYFDIKIPATPVALLALLSLGLLSGSIATFFIHYQSTVNIVRYVAEGAGAGIIVVSVPAMLTAIFIKTMRRKIKMRNSLFATLPVSFVYSLLIIIDSGVYSFMNNQALAYLLLLLGNAGIYGYWFLVNKVAVGQRRSAIITALVQPIINILFYLPLGKYLFAFGFPFDTALEKLYGGMAVFLIASYAIVYVLDRPVKKGLNVSGIELLSSVIGSSLYNLAADAAVLGKGGTKKDLDIDVVAIKGSKGYKAIFVNPDIHFGPFYNVGGSTFPSYMGNAIARKYRAAPFIIHSTVNIDDNPMSSRDSEGLANNICRNIDLLNGRDFKDAHGYLRIGKAAPCTAINLHLNNVNLLVLTKAPMVTEDIDGIIGMELKSAANADGSSTILVDAHNSRFETAGRQELDGVSGGSKYAGLYKTAISKAVGKPAGSDLRFGAAYKNLSAILKNSKDLGNGYASVGIFEFHGRKFGLVFFDANNMLPGFRSGVISHIKQKYGFPVELCTTDSHAVNTLALTASNALGRKTKVGQVIPLIDDMIDSGLKSMEPARMAHLNMEVKNFAVWGAGSREEITEVGMRIVRQSKYVVPFLILAAFIIAAWIIYIV